MGLVGEDRGRPGTEPRLVGANPRVLWYARPDMAKLADSFEAFMRSLGPLVPRPLYRPADPHDAVKHSGRRGDRQPLKRSSNYAQ